MMEARRESPSPQRSRSSSRRRTGEHSSSKSPQHVKSIVRSMLKARAFIGQYVATQRVDVLGDYRDVIQVEEKDSLVAIIAELQLRIRQAFPESWPGVTIPGDLASRDGHCFWVKQADHLFEPHHYRISDIQFVDHEVCFVIKAEEKVVPEVSHTEQSFYDALNSSKEMLQEQSKKLAVNAWELMTWENLKNTARFLGALILALGAAGVYLMDYFIKLMHATTGLVKVSMPAIIKVLDIVQKIIGAIFVFVAMIWKDCVRSNRREYYDDNPRYIKYK